jgi:hypothetical protein
MLNLINKIADERMKEGRRIWIHFYSLPPLLMESERVEGLPSENKLL